MKLLTFFFCLLFFRWRLAFGVLGKLSSTVYHYELCIKVKYKDAGLVPVLPKFSRSTNYDIPVRMTFADLTDFHNISAPIRYKGHNPKSPEDDVVGGYIRLSDQHKLRKVRNTVYEDPGNPFHSDAFGLPIIPSLVDDDTNSSDAWKRWGSNSTEDPPSPSRANQDMFSMLSDPFDLATGADGTPSSQDSKDSSEILENINLAGTSYRETFQSSSSSDRRSMSVDIGFFPNDHQVQGQETPPTGQSTPQNFQSLNSKRPIENNRRDTKFYDFYDSILAEYAIEPRDTSRLKQQPLPAIR